MQMTDLLKLFYQKKILLILTTVLGLVIGLTVIFFSKPVYEAKINLLAATDGDIAGFNMGRSWDHSPLKPITARDVHRAFSMALLSESLKDLFLKQSQGLLPKNLAIVANPMTAMDRFIKYRVAIRGDNPKQVAVWLDQLTHLIKEQTVNILLQDMKQQNEVVIENLNRQIDIARKAAKVQRQDRIAQLKEKAHALQLASASIPFWDDEPAVMNDASETPVNLDMIRAEIKNLSARSSDDAFIPDLRNLQAKLEFYKSLRINPDKVTVFRLDGLIETPTTPIAPRQRLIVLVCLFLGFMIGALSVMLKAAWTNL